MRGARTGKRNGKTHFNSRDRPRGKGVYEAAKNLSTESDSEEFKILYIENGFPRWHSGEEPPASAGDSDSIPGSGRSRNGNHSSALAWGIPWTEEPGGLWSTGHKELDATEYVHTRTHTHTHIK